MRLTNSYFNQFTSISPQGSKGEELKENESTNSAFYQDRLKDSISTRLHSQYLRSSQNLHVIKLQSKVLELKNKIDSQRYQIQTLGSEVEVYRRLCEQQKQELNNHSSSMLKQEFQEQISDLLSEKNKLCQLINNLHNDYKEAEIQDEKEIDIMKMKNNELAREIQQNLQIKQNILKELEKIKSQETLNQQAISEQEERLDELRNIERKLKIALKQMNSLQGQ